MAYHQACSEHVTTIRVVSSLWITIRYWAHGLPSVHVQIVSAQIVSAQFVSAQIVSAQIVSGTNCIGNKLYREHILSGTNCIGNKLYRDKLYRVQFVSGTNCIGSLSFFYPFILCMDWGKMRTSDYLHYMVNNFSTSWASEQGAHLRLPSRARTSDYLHYIVIILSKWAGRAPQAGRARAALHNMEIIFITA